MLFEVGRVYNRRQEIHKPYGGQWQGGISTPKDHPFVFLFIGESGEQYGYKDGLDKNGVFLYKGEGQVGDMEFRGGNRAIRDHAENGKDLHLFESLSKGKGYRYLGMFACSSWEYRQGIGLNGEERQVIVFHLVHPSEEDQVAPSSPTSPDKPLDQLCQLALEAASGAEQSEPQEAKSLYYKRSTAVRRYVLERAGGVCESCRKPAPFVRINGTPYLEPHHTRRVSDGGPDHPWWVGAICPNCHREIHHGDHGQEKNEHFQQYLALLEK
jgi:5-methylcytosine-specific restriction enzyme A